MSNEEIEQKLQDLRIEYTNPLSIRSHAAITLQAKVLKLILQRRKDYQLKKNGGQTQLV